MWNRCLICMQLKEICREDILPHQQLNADHLERIPSGTYDFAMQDYLQWNSVPTNHSVGYWFLFYRICHCSYSWCYYSRIWNGSQGCSITSFCHTIIQFEKQQLFKCIYDGKRPEWKFNPKEYGIYSYNFSIFAKVSLVSHFLFITELTLFIS